MRSQRVLVVVDIRPPLSTGCVLCENLLMAPSVVRRVEPFIEMVAFVLL
jgi:hypothetical protein